LASWLIVSLVHTGTFTFVVCNQSLLRYGGVTAASLSSGEWCRLLTSQFLHVYFPHAVLNAAAVAVIGSQIERVVGRWRFVILYLCAGTAGQLSAVAGTPEIVATGASQAALGLAAGALVLLVRNEQSRVQAFAPLGYVVIQVALDLMFAGIIKLPHVVSFGVGACVAASWRCRTGETRRAGPTT
jgi:rhomboid protease GluP